MPTTNAVTTGVESQPLVGPSMIAHSRVARPTIDITAPGRSSRGAAGSRESGIR